MSSPPSATKTTAGPGQPSLIRKIGTEGLVRETFDDVALLIGSVAALHHLNDDVVWSVMKRLDRIRVRLLRDLKGVSRREDFEPTAPEPPRVHPAVDEFLARNRAGMGE